MGHERTPGVVPSDLNEEEPAVEKKNNASAEAPRQQTAKHVPVTEKKKEKGSSGWDLMKGVEG